MLSLVSLKNLLGLSLLIIFYVFCGIKPHLFLKGILNVESMSSNW